MFTKLKRKLCIVLILVMSSIAISVTALLPASQRVMADSYVGPAVTFATIDGTIQTDGHGDEGYDKLVDGVKTSPTSILGKASKWCLDVPESGMPSEGFYVVFDAHYKVNVSAYTLYTANDNPTWHGRNPKDWVLYGSNDYGSESTTWTAIHTVTNDNVMQDTEYGGYEYNVQNNSSYYRYYKFVVNSIQSGTVFQLGEMEFDFTVDPTEFHYVVLDSTSSHTASSEGPEKILDGQKTTSGGTKWCTSINSGASVTFKTSESVKVNGYVITTANDNTSFTGRNPNSWTLYGSSDYNESSKTGTWTEIDSVENDTTMADENYTAYTFNVTDNTNFYQYYKLNITKVKTSSELQFSEFELVYTTCSHNWEETSSVPATCTTAKQVTSTCSLCQETKTESVGSPNGHDWNTTSTEEATCTLPKKLHQTCSSCSATQTITDGVANGHDWNTTSVQEATCTLPKRINQTCSACSATQTITESEAYGHSYLNGYCTRCHKREDGVTVGALVVTGGTLNTDYKYENNVLTILTSTPLTIANVDVTTATTADRIYISKDVSANITLAGVNIDKSWANYQYNVTASTVLGVSALEIADDSTGNVVITLAENTVNTLRSGLYAAGLQKNGLNGTLFICGKGKLIAYGGQDGAGIGAGDKYDDEAPSATVYANNITIVDCVVEAYASRLSNGEVAEEGFNTSIAVGIGSKSLLPTGVTGHISIINATVTAAGQGRDYAIGHSRLSGHFEDVVIEGGSVKCIEEMGIVDTPINVNSTPLYLLTLSNPNGGIITIDGRYYTPYTHSATDTNVYAYLSGESHSVWVGDTFKLYSFNSETSAFEVNDTVDTPPASEQPKALTITAKSDSETLISSDYTYTDGILTVTTTKEVVISSSGIKTTDRIAIATDDAKVTLNNVIIDVSATTDACALEISVNGVTLTLNEGSVNILKSGSNKPGLSFSVPLTVSTPSLTINGEGTLYAYGGENGAGIGSGNNADADGFTIQNANIYAYGGDNGAGIGSGNNGKVNSNITITNAVVIAVGGKNGAGIGSGKDGTEAKVVISGSVISATGGNSAAGIGSGNGGASYTVSITDSTVLAVGGNYDSADSSVAGAGIGNGTEGTVTISGSSVNAIGGLTSSETRTNAIGGGEGKEAITPTDGENALYLLTIPNPDDEDVFIDGSETKNIPSNSSCVSDSNLYLYLTGALHSVTLGETTTYYCFNSTTKTYHVCVKGTTLQHDDDYHWYACTVEGCSTQLDKTTHTHDQQVINSTYLSSEATCTEAAKYYNSCACGHKGSTTLSSGNALGHDFTGDWTTTDTTHTKTCLNGCGTTQTNEHSFTQQVVNQTYHCSDATCTEAAKYYYSCECGYKGTTTFDNGNALDHDFDMTTWTKDATHHYHACKREGCSAYDTDTYGVHDYTHDCDADCNTCGYIRAESSLTHSPTTTWAYNDSTHYKTCTRKLDNDTTCGAVCESVTHTYSNNLYHYENGKHYRKCDTCDYHDASTEQTCNNTVVYDNDFHSVKCSTCAHVFSTAVHDFTNACDTTCNYTGCEFVRTITHDFSPNWSSDNTHHWHACNVCGEPDDKLPHEGLSTTHYDEDDHWHQCTTCLTIVGKENHVYNDEHDFTCNECPFYIPQQIGSLKFTYSGYVLNGNTTAFKVLSDTSNVGLEWNNDNVYDYYWWIITDIDKYLTGEFFDNYLWGSFDIEDTVLTLNNSLRPDVDYWVGIWLHATEYYEFENVTCNDIYIEGLGYALHVDTSEAYTLNKEVCAYFKLPKLTGESNVQTVPQLTFDVGNYQVGNDVLDLTLTPSSSNAVTFDYYCEYPLIDHSWSNDADWYNGATFSADHGYALSLTICAPYGYDFNNFDLTNVKVMVGNEVCTVAYCHAYSNGAVIYLSIDLPTFKENHVHDYQWHYDDVEHWQECSCGKYGDNFITGTTEHVYDDAHDETCNDCGYVRPLSATGAQFSLSGYTINGATSSLNFALITENPGFTIEGLFIGFSCDDKLVNSTLITPTEKCYFLSGNTYWVVALIGASSYGENKTYSWTGLTADDFTIPDVCSSAYAIMPSGDEAILIFKLPALQGENQIPTVGNSQFTLSGYELDGLISSASLTQAPTNTGFSILNFKITKNGSVVDSATETFNSDDGYGFILTLCADDGYTFMGATKDTFNVIGAYELTETSFSAGYGSVTLRYSLLKLKGEHNHAYTIDKFNETHHWKECVCGTKQNVTAHSYSNETDTTCERCSYERKLPVQTIIIRLDGYLYANYAESITLTHSSPYVKSFYDYGFFDDGHSYCLGTSVGIGTSLDYTSILTSELLKANTDYYLGIRLVAQKSTYDFSAFVAQNVKLELNGEYFTPTEWLDFGLNFYQITFKLPKLITAHAHDCVAVDAVAPTCVSVGNIAHMLCQTCGKYFDDKGLELATVTVAIDPDAHAYAHKHGPEVHWEQCTLCEHVKADSSKLHVYDDALDCSCNVCSYVRETPVTNVTLTLNGYVTDGIITNITAELDDSTVGIVWENTSYTDYDYVIITDFNAHLEDLIKSNRDDFTHVVTDSGYFLTNTAYWLAVRLESEEAYRLDALTNENAYINGVCVATYIDTTYFALGKDYAYVYFKLPELKGQSNVVTMPELDVELSGYEANSVANDVTLSATENYAVTDVEFSVRVLVNGRTLDVTDTTTKFNVTSAYSLTITVTAGANYTFIGYDETTLKVKDFGELKITDLWISDGGSTAIITCNLPSLMGTHAHMYANFISCDDEHHHHKCVVCNQFFDLGEHVYSNNADKTCNVCNYERELQVTSINFSLVNFGIGKEVENLKVISAQGNIGFDWSTAKYFRDYVIYCNQSNDFSTATVIQKNNNDAFLPDLYYWLIIDFPFDDDWRADYLTKSNVTVDGVGSPLFFLYDDESNYATLVFTLPQLIGKNTLVKVEDVEFNFVGYNLGSVINNTNLTVVTERGLAQRSRYVYENGSRITNSSTLFSPDKKYTVEIELLSLNGYTFYGADLSTIVVNGVGELISYEYSAGYGTLKLKYSLPSLASEHEHDFSVWERSDTHHWKVCSLCGVDTEEKQAHVYDDNLDTTCNVCSHVRLLPIQKLTITLQGYKVGNKLSQLQLNCNDWNFKKYGDEFILSSTPETILGMFSDLPSSTILLHETSYYLVIRIADSSSSQIHDIGNITENDIELVGYGKPDQLMIYNVSSSATPVYNCFAIYTLTAFETPHSHFGEWHDVVPATCVSTGVKGYGICDTCGEKYDAEGRIITELTIAKNKDNHAHGLTKVDGVAATASSVGNITYYYCADCGKYYTDANGENEITLADTVLAKLAPSVTSGNNEKWTKQSDSTLTFTSNALKSDFIGVTVDGVLIDAENYVVGEDELTITLNSDFMKTLSVGKHTISIKSQSGDATATFYVKNAKKGISVGGWIGISLGGVVVLAGAAFGIWFFIKKRKNVA